MRSYSIEIAPSILSADFRNLEREVKAAQDCGAHRIHCDIMDGHFVPNITFGPMVVEAVKKSVSIPLDVHLMISHPEKYYNQFVDAGADILTVHAETCVNLPEILAAIRKRGVRAGVTVNPDKDIDLFLPYLEQIDQVLIMTVYAGFGGQKFMHEMLPKISRVKDAIMTVGNTIDLQVDGGINETTAALCAQNGVNVFVAGNFVFSASNYKERIDMLHHAAGESLTK